MWRSIVSEPEVDGFVGHIVPVDDIKEHTLNAECWCTPMLDEEFGLVVHNSLDRREEYETGQRKFS